MHVAERDDRLRAHVSGAEDAHLARAQARGHVVGFIGDGINDAPSLHAADVGIAVPGAVDVAREAADILLTKRGLDVLHGGILEGRRAFGNVMKYLLMGTSSNFGNMLSMARGVAAPAVLADASHADPAQQPALRCLADHHPDRPRGRELDAPAASLRHRPRAALHGPHRAHQLGVRLPDVLRAAPGLPRRSRPSFRPAGSSNPSAPRRSSSS